MWNIEKDLRFVQELQGYVQPLGFYVGLTGSVLFNGESSNDIDVILYPADSSKMNLTPVWEKLEELGWTRIASRGRVASVWENRYQSTDMKNVEKWREPSGRIVDIFHLR